MECSSVTVYDIQRACNTKTVKKTIFQVSALINSNAEKEGNLYRKKEKKGKNHVLKPY